MNTEVCPFDYWQRRNFTWRKCMCQFTYIEMPNTQNVQSALDSHSIHYFHFKHTISNDEHIFKDELKKVKKGN